MTYFLGIALAPFVAAALLMIARPLAQYIRAKIPDGALKRILFFSWGN